MSSEEFLLMSDGSLSSPADEQCGELCNAVDLSVTIQPRVLKSAFKLKIIWSSKQSTFPKAKDLRRRRNVCESKLLVTPISLTMSFFMAKYS